MFFFVMNLIKLYILLICSLLFSACTATFAIRQSEVQLIEFGYGGGVTQNVTSFVINSDGIVQQKGKIIRKIPKRELSKIFEDAANLGNSFNYPQNTFSYIRVTKTNTEYYYCWSEATSIPIITLFSKLNNYTK